MNYKFSEWLGNSFELSNWLDHVSNGLDKGKTSL